MWFSCCDGCFELHDTEEEARNAAQEALDDATGNAIDGWPEWVDGIVWGRVVQQVVTLNERKATPEDAIGCEYICEKELHDVDTEYRCNICGGAVRFDGTKPAIS